MVLALQRPDGFMRPPLPPSPRCREQTSIHASTRFRLLLDTQPAVTAVGRTGRRRETVRRQTPNLDNEPLRRR